MAKKIKLMAAVKSVDYKGKPAVRVKNLVLDKYGQSLDLGDKPLTTVRIKRILDKLSDGESEPKVKGKGREENTKVKKTKKSKAPEFKFNEVTFGKTVTPGYEFCSNMFPTAIYCLVDGEYIMFYSVEQAFQYMKTNSKSHQQKIINCIKPKDARYHGSARAECPLRDDWEEVKVDVMFQLLKGKYSQNKVMAEKILETGNVPIVEIAPWDKENFWGVNEKREGKNHTGKLTEKVRSWLRKMKEQNKTTYFTPELSHGE